MASQYLPMTEYSRLVSTLKRIAVAVPSLRIERSAWTGTVTDDEVKIALGEQLDIWPESIRDDAAV